MIEGKWMAEYGNADRCRKLWTAVVELALADIVHGTAGTPGRRAAWYWIFNPLARGFNSFQSLCREWDMDGERIKRHLVRWAAEHGFNKETGKLSVESKQVFRSKRQ